MKCRGVIASLIGGLAFASLLVACGGGSFSGIAPFAVTLSLATSSGGQITLAPGDLTCTSSCQATYSAGSEVTLTAVPGDDYEFDSWSSGCTGTNPACTLTLMDSIQVTASFAPKVPVAQAPYVDYTDIVSGPNSGGENGLGAYLSIFGTGFGQASGLGSKTRVFIGGVEVANYRYLGPSRVAPKQGLQQIVVQVGALGDPAPGEPLNVKVVVNNASSNIDHTFTPNPGRIFFVALDGDDDSGVPDDVTRPYRHLQTPSNGGLAAILHAGDTIVIRGGAWSDIGYDSSWFRFRYPNQQGSQPTGKMGSGWIHFTAYPGPVNGNRIEDVHYTTPANMRGGFQGANSAYFGTTGDFVSISNLHMEVDANATNDAAPANLQYSNGPWRVVNNELGPWPSAIHSKAAGVSGHGDGTVVFGNLIHDMACVGASENHGIYADSGASNWEIGYNWIHDITGGNLIQFYDNVGLAGNDYTGFPKNWLGFVGMKVHHNWLEVSGKYGLNMADGIVSGSIWNNVIKGSLYSGLRINTISKNMNMTIVYNTFYDNDRLASGSGNAQVLNTWGNYDPTGVIRIHDNIFAAGPDTLRTSTYYRNVGSGDGYLDFRSNLYFDNGYGWGTNFTRDPAALYGNPIFVDAAADDFHLSAGSPAINTGEWTLPFITAVDDFSATVARPVGGVNDIGAFEWQGP
jgi:hypothetical protein